MAFNIFMHLTCFQKLSAHEKSTGFGFRECGRQFPRRTKTKSPGNPARTINVICTNIASLVNKTKTPMTQTTTTTRSARLGLRATPEQEAVLRRAAEVSHKSLTDFILDAAYQAAEQTLLDQRLFVVSSSQYQALLEMLDRPESENAGLADLFSRKPVFAKK
jgi:uncharacterized protein (DUF1778 family)